MSAAVLVAAVLASNVAQAGPGGGRGRGHGFHHHGGRVVVFAAPVFAARYYFPPAYYYPPPVYYPPAPAVYIEQPQYQPQSQAYWYYCPSSRAYYPQVQSCASGWQRVAPQPPPG